RTCRRTGRRRADRADLRWPGRPGEPGRHRVGPADQQAVPGCDSRGPRLRPGQAHRGRLHPAGAPLLAGTCARHGVAGVFAYRDGSWQAAGPSLPASLASQQIQVLRLTRTGTRDVALLQAGTGPAATLVAAWSADGSHWTLSAPLRPG